MAELENQIKDVKTAQEENTKKLEAMVKASAKIAKHAMDNMDEEQKAKYKAEIERDQDIKKASDDNEDMKKAIYENVKKDENYTGPGNEPKIASLQAEIETLKKEPVADRIINMKGFTAKKDITAEKSRLMEASMEVLQAKEEELIFMAKKIPHMVPSTTLEGNSNTRPSVLSLDQAGYSAGMINPYSQYQAGMINPGLTDDATGGLSASDTSIQQLSAKSDKELLAKVGWS